MINNTCQTMESDPLFRKIGIKLVLMMPLIWLTNKWELFIIFNETKAIGNERNKEQSRAS